MRPGRALLSTALAFLFLAEAQRALFGSVYGLLHDAVRPDLRPLEAGLALLPLACVLAPLLPLARWLDRGGAVALALAGLAVFRVPMTLPDPAVRAVAAALVFGAGGVFLTWAVGFLDRRALAAGAVAGLVVDQLLRVGGASWDLSLRSGWLPVQAALSLGLLVLVLRRDRPAVPPPADVGTTEGAEGLERRTGGLRLRGALALAALLFLELHLLGVPAAVARWTGVGHDAVVVGSGVAGGVAFALALAAPGAARARVVSLALLAAAAAAVLAGWWGSGAIAAALMVAGHGAALLLLGRTLSPASGRRGRGIVAGSLGLFCLLAGALALMRFPADGAALLPAGEPWVFVAALAVLAGSLALLPQPAASPPLSGAWPAAAAGVAVIAAGLLWALAGGEAPGPPRPAEGRLRVASLGLRDGRPRGTFDPGAHAARLAAVDADIVALRDAPPPHPGVYGADLGLWLARRLDARAVPAGRDAVFLVRVPFDSVTPTARGPDGARLATLHPTGLPRVHLLTLPRADEAAASAGAAAAARAEVIGPWLGTGPAIVVAGPPGDPLAALGRAMRDLGFADALRPGSAGAGAGSAVAGGLWVRGLRALESGALVGGASAQRLLFATLQVAGPGSR